uniref:RING-type domain-containing protein n=1 Tax=Leersia perrieri TaxID=77586 RepID=A0A0D9XND7_9ORYZ
MRRLGDVAVEAPPALVTTPAWAATTGAGGALASSSLQQSGNSGFDSSMVIILAALLCFLICALGLSSLIRCALHCARSLSPAAATATPSATAGLKRNELRRIPVEVYGTKEAGVADAECAICLGDFAAGDKVRVLPRCHHGFHVRCVDTWLAVHSSCPTCRDSVISVEDGVAGDDDATPTAGGQR